jgi:nucleoside-diphosphate-sugar epimerase
MLVPPEGDSYSLFDTPDEPDSTSETQAEPAPEAELESESDLDAMSATVLLTGGTGLIGSHAAALFREMGWRVRALIRPTSDAAFLEELGCEFVVADLTDPDAVSGAAAGCEVVVHSAAQLGKPASMDRHVEVNVEGTRRILKEAIDAAVRRFVHISSVAAYGAPFDESILPLDEETPLDDPIPEEDHYSLTKRMAEEVVRKVGRRIEWCILRPDIVMGERDRLFTPRILRWASRPVLSTLGMGANDLPLVYAGNVALAVWLAATQDAAAWQTYNVTDDGELTQKTLVRIAAGRGPDAPVLPVPVPLVAAACRIGTVFGRIIPGVRPGVLTPRRIRLFTEGDPYDGALIREELGWKPTVSTEDGWRRSVEWYRAYMARKASTGLEVRNEA